jgi:hypothetical protein
MADKLTKARPQPVKAEPGKLQPKKAAAHRQTIEDAAKYNAQPSAPAATAATGAPAASVGDDYEGGKVVSARVKASKLDEDVQMVADLDRWG